MSAGLAGTGTSGFVLSPGLCGGFRKDLSALRRSSGRDVSCSRSDGQPERMLREDRRIKEAHWARRCSSGQLCEARAFQSGTAGSRIKDVMQSSWECLDSVFRTLSSSSPAFQCMAFAMPSLPGGGWSDLWKNRIFVAGLLAWFLAQFGKIFTKRFTKGVWDLMAFRDSGGMPSSHSAMSMAVTTAIALDVGMRSPMFTIALCFTSIVMYDAAGVRKHAGYQAQVLNSLVEHAGLPDTHPFSARKLKEVLGHTPRQVIAGGLLGMIVGMFAPCAS